MKLPLLLLLSSACLGGLSFSETNTRPNVVFILADDLGWTDLTCQGSKFYQTPNIDRLAAEGLRFQQYHNCQNCQPTRAALMSGQYGARTRVYTVGGIQRFNWQSRPLRPVDNVTELPLDRITVAQSLKATGYATAMFGKWHLGEKRGHHPAERGFDEAIVSMGQHFDFETNPKVEVPKGAYLADFLTDKAVDFISKNKEKPFFLYLPHFGVHSPLQAKEELKKRFQDKPGAGGHSNPTYAAMIASVDESVGRIVKTLADLNLSEKTVVIFSSDNGGVEGYEREGLSNAGHDTTSNAPLRSGKGSLYEGGIRTPFIVRWPGVVKPGGISETPALHVDVYPTLLEITGSPRPSNYILDGESLVSVMKEPAKSLGRDAIFQHFPGYLGMGEDKWRTTPVGVIQSGDWKLMEFFEDQHLELYNLREDVGESRNLAQAMPEKARELRSKMAAWRESVHAPMPTPNEDIKPLKKQKDGKRQSLNSAGEL